MDVTKVGETLIITDADSIDTIPFAQICNISATEDVVYINEEKINNADLTVAGVGYATGILAVKAILN